MLSLSVKSVGTYRARNITYDYTIPASALVAGANTLKIYVVSGSCSTSPWLTPGYAFDAMDLTFHEYRLRRDPSHPVTWDNRDNIRIAELDDLWMRDTGPVFVGEWRAEERAEHAGKLLVRRHVEHDEQPVVPPHHD